MRAGWTAQYWVHGLVTESSQKLTITTVDEGQEFTGSFILGERPLPRVSGRRFLVQGHSHQFKPLDPATFEEHPGTWVTIRLAADFQIDRELAARFEQAPSDLLHEVSTLLRPVLEERVKPRVLTIAALASAHFPSTVWEEWQSFPAFINSENKYWANLKGLPVEGIRPTSVSKAQLEEFGQLVIDGLSFDSQTTVRLGLAADIYLEARAAEPGSNLRLLGLYQTLEILAGLVEREPNDPIYGDFAELERVVAGSSPRLKALIAGLKSRILELPIRERFQYLANEVSAETAVDDLRRFTDLTRLRARLVHGAIRGIQQVPGQPSPHREALDLARKYLLAFVRLPGPAA
jgi:hypothetical protein